MTLGTTRRRHRVARRSGTKSGITTTRNQWRLFDVFVAELQRNIARPQTHRTVAFGVGGVIVALGAAVVQGQSADLESVSETLDGIRAVLPIAAALFAALLTGNWWTTGTAGLVAMWVPHRRVVPIAEVVATAAVSTFVGGALWASALIVFGGRAAVGGVAPLTLVGSQAGAGGRVLASTFVAGLLGAAVGLLVRSAAGGVLAIVAVYLFGEPLVRVVAASTLGPVTSLVLPVSAMSQISGISGFAANSSTLNPWLVCACWVAVLWAAATRSYMRRDLA